MSESTRAVEHQAPSSPLLLNTQYVKELSFRVPGAPSIYANLPERPHVVLALDVLVRPIPDGVPQPIYEVTLTVKCEATVSAPEAGAPPPAVAYQIELGYAGIFTLAQVPQSAIEPVLLAECPRLLFPFARSLLASITREAGFAPVLLQPLDFVAFWQTKRQQTAQLAAQATHRHEGPAGDGGRPSGRLGLVVHFRCGDGALSLRYSHLNLTLVVRPMLIWALTTVSPRRNDRERHQNRFASRS